MSNATQVASEMQHVNIGDTLAWQVQRELVNKYFALPSQHGESHQPSLFSNPTQELVDEVFLVNAAAEMLRMSDDSRLRMLRIVSDGHQQFQKALPDYVEDKPHKSLTKLLKESGVKLSVRMANLILQDMGFLEKQTRMSTKNPSEMKSFWCLTKAGLEYGKNLVSPNSPRETQPHYYVEKFPELLDKILAFQTGGRPHG